MNAVLQVLNYEAAYRGNFIESIESLDLGLHQEAVRNVYLFCASAKTTDARKWIDEMAERGCVTEFLTNDSSENIGLIMNLIATYKVKLVHTHFITMEQYRDVNASVPKSIPIVMHMHNHSRKGNFLKEIVRRFIYRRCIMVACSESVYRSLERDYPGNEKYYIDNGVKFERLDNWSVIEPSEYNVPETDKKCLIFGFDFYRKGVDLAIKAISDLRKEGHSYTLLISLSTNFEYVEEQIKLILGEVPDWVRIIKARNDVASLYNYVDLFLSPSREEGLPYSVVEAEYCNCSVVLSDISAQAKLKLKFGYWFKDGDVEGLKSQILKAASERDKKLEQIDMVKDYMKESYSLDKWSQAVIALYSNISKRSKND